MSWEEYLKNQKDQPLRSLYLKAMESFPKQLATANHYSAIDFGSGAGIETIDLLNRGWQATAIDRELSSKDTISTAINQQNNFKFIHSAFENLKELPSCDFFFAYDSLSFIKRNSFNKTWELIVNSIALEGIFAGTFFAPQHAWVLSGDCLGFSLDSVKELCTQFDISYLEESNKDVVTELNGKVNWNSIEIIAQRKS